MTDETFALWLMRAKSAANLRSCELAKRMDVKHSVLTQFEQGKCEPAFKTLIKLARALNVSTDYLCGLRDTP